MKFILGTKQKMTQLFDADGRVHPATIISVGPVVVTQVKQNDKDGYEAIQIGYGNRAPKQLTKAQKGHFKDLGSFRHVKEFRHYEKGDKEYAVGETLDASVFEKGERVNISSISKGKGFQGVVKRHGFGGGRRSHGQKHSEREPGSIGATNQQRVFKGVRMAGRMGGDRITIKRVLVLAVDPKNNQLVVKGAVPGRRGTVVEIRTA